jgi:2-hydroxychromene-2-carboxylate isomerase
LLILHKEEAVRSRHLVFGDFNCPYSYLASTRADVLIENGLVELEWRAVEHDATIPRRGRRVEGETAKMLEREFDDVVTRLGSHEHLDLHTPAVIPNAALATLAFAGCDARDADGLRRRLFTALWRDGRNIGDVVELERLLRRPFRSNASVAAYWRSSWRGLDRPMVPMMMLPTGWVLRGIDVLEYLSQIECAQVVAEAAESRRSRPEAPCADTRRGRF